MELAIKDIPGVLNIIATPDGTVEVECPPGDDIRPIIARKVIQAGYSLLELKAVGLSLEDIFMQLTREEPEPPSTDDSEADVIDAAAADILKLERP